MAARRQRRARAHRGASITIPGMGVSVPVPDRASLAWYAGLGVMAGTELIEWPVAAVIAASHLIERRAHRQAVKELAEGVEAGA